MPDSEEFDARLVRTFLPQAGVQVDESAWPASVPAMAQLLREGLELPAGLTVLVGENGCGRPAARGRYVLITLISVDTLAGGLALSPPGRRIAA